MIAFHHVRKTFGPVVALDGVSFEIRPGERVAFVGTNGSGKTTLLRALLGLVRIEGSIHVAGVDVAGEPEVALRSIAYIPQIAPPLDAPVGEVLRTHAAIRGTRVEETHARGARLGLDVEACQGKRFRELSGGTKQKLLAAMALASAAPVLVCDEPTANLDGRAREAFFAQLAERGPDGVLILCSHRADEVRKLVRRVIELEGGRVRRDGEIEPSVESPDAWLETPSAVRNGRQLVRTS